MTSSALPLLLLTLLLCAFFAVIVVRTLRKDRKQKLEEPKHRMLDDD